MKLLVSDQVDTLTLTLLTLPQVSTCTWNAHLTEGLTAATQALISACGPLLHVFIYCHCSPK